MKTKPRTIYIYWISWLSRVPVIGLSVDLYDYLLVWLDLYKRWDRTMG